jgi:hypothetical protein
LMSSKSDKQFDPANPENQPILEKMEGDGEFLRDVREGKTASELAFGLELGSDEQHLEDVAHETLFTSMGAVIEEEHARTTPEPDTSPIAPDSPPPVNFFAGFDDAVADLNLDGLFNVPPPPVPAANPDAAAAEFASAIAVHDERMAELTGVADKEHSRIRPKAERQEAVKDAAQQRSAERLQRMAARGDVRAAQRLRAEHGERFVELGQVVEDAQPPEPGAPLGVGPDAVARIAHPGREKPNQLGEALAQFAEEDKAWRSAVAGLFKEMANDLRNARLELDSIRGFLERSRL